MITVDPGHPSAPAPVRSAPRPKARTPSLLGPEPNAADDAPAGDPPCRIIVAHEPLAYREALAGALSALRSHAEVAIVAPADLDDEVERRLPDLVFVGRLSQAVQAHARAWVLVYPGGERVVETCVAGERVLAADLSLDAALALVDRVAVPVRVR